MKRKRSLSLLALALPVLTSAHADEPPTVDSVKVSGAIEAHSEWSVTRAKEVFAMEIRPVEYTSHEAKHLSNCVSLLTFLKQCGVGTELKMDPTADPATKNPPLRKSIVVRGRDGYVATLSLAELLPELGNKEAWLALDVDGQPLPAKEGPMKLIVPTDVKPARWVRGVGSIVISEPAPTTQAARPTPAIGK